MKGISVIVCCYNSAVHLPQTLTHLLAQRTENFPWEVILVNNGSTDNTIAVAEKVWKSNHSKAPLIFVEERRQGLAFARQKGIDSATFDVLIFCDDDNWLDQNYLTKAFEIMNANREIGALGGRGFPVAESGFPNWFETYKYNFACYRQAEEEGELKEETASLFGAGLVVRREALVKLKDRKFSPILTDRLGKNLSSGGDTELCFAIRMAGFKLWYSDQLQFRHFLPASRLTINYLYKLNRSLSECSSKLIVYRYALKDKKVDQVIWVKDVLHQSYQLSRALFRCLSPRHTSLEKRLSVDFSYQSFVGIVTQFGKYKRSYERILKLR